MRWTGCAAAAVMCCTAPATAQQRAPAGAEQFVRKLYANAGNSELLMAGTWHWQDHLSKRTRALYRRYDGLRPGEPDSVSDTDWLCQCQDPDGVRLTALSVVLGTKGIATATARISFPGTRNTKTVQLVLVNEGTWRLDDIILPRGARYSIALTYEIGRYTRRR